MAEKQVTKKKTNGRPPQIRPKIEPAIIGKLLGESYEAYKQPKVKDLKELMDRFDDYFDRCIRRQIIPTVEEMASWTGYSQATVWDWEAGRTKGLGEGTSEVIKKAKEILQTFDGKLAITGQINPLIYFFRAKNYYGMVDKQEHVITPNTENVTINVDDIKNKYSLPTTDIPEIELDDLILTPRATFDFRCFYFY